MWRLVVALLFGMALADARASEELQQAFTEAMQQLHGGHPARAESILRDMLSSTDSPRVKLELARALYAQEKYTEAKPLFREVALRDDTPWRVRDNIALFIQDIEEKTGYVKFGFSIISDSNPRNLAGQKEFSIAGLRVTPAEAPEKMWGLRYSARGWLPLSDVGRMAVYGSASYTDLPTGDFDRLTLDGGVVRSLTESGRVRGRIGVEVSNLGGRMLYQMPYIGLDAVLLSRESTRVVGETKLGKLKLPEYSYQDAMFSSAAVSLRRSIAPGTAATLRTGLEYSRAEERAYTYYGADVTPGLNWLWLETAYFIGAAASFGSRRYGDVDPLFGAQRADTRKKLELSVGNRNWRWRQSYISLVASVEDNRSSVEFYSYRRANVSIAVE